VAEAVALGVADPRLGQAVHLVVRGSEDDAARADLPKRLQRDLPNFMQPQHIHWRDAMPLNPNGKIDRTALQTALTKEFAP
jgi:acyl-coenzyme A synthetase/AMP-(fatty) acid ligase